MGRNTTTLDVRFFRTEAGNEPVREWLTSLPRTHKYLIGTEIKTIQIGWPLGMPIVRKLGKGLWEARVNLENTIARVLFTVDGNTMILLHGFIKKSQKTPAAGPGRRQAAPSRHKEAQAMTIHIGSDFDDFLASEDLAEEVSAAALKRVIAWQIAEAMKAQKISKKALAERMHTSRTAVDRALDQNDSGMTLATLASAARALGHRVEVRLIPENSPALA